MERTTPRSLSISPRMLPPAPKSDSHSQARTSHSVAIHRKGRWLKVRYSKYLMGPSCSDLNLSVMQQAHSSDTALRAAMWRRQFASALHRFHPEPLVRVLASTTSSG